MYRPNRIGPKQIINLSTGGANYDRHTTDLANSGSQAIGTSLRIFTGGGTVYENSISSRITVNTHQTLASYHEVGYGIILKSPFESADEQARLLTFSGAAAAGDKDDDRIDIIPIVAQFDTTTIDGSALMAQDGTPLWTPINCNAQTSKGASWNTELVIYPTQGMGGSDPYYKNPYMVAVLYRNGSSAVRKLFPLIGISATWWEYDMNDVYDPTG